jgi:hypothetical protein
MAKSLFFKIKYGIQMVFTKLMTISMWVTLTTQSYQGKL